jgi:hypothetical protein
MLECWGLPPDKDQFLNQKSGTLTFGGGGGGD